VERREGGVRYGLPRSAKCAAWATAVRVVLLEFGSEEIDDAARASCDGSRVRSSAAPRRVEPWKFFGPGPEKI